MISLKIKFVFVVMRFDLLLMLIINLTVFLIISVRVVSGYVDGFVNAPEKNEKKRREEKNVNIGVSKFIFSFVYTSTRNRFFNADGTTTFILHFHFILFIFYISLLHIF